ncbi:type VI secretion system protein TssL, short form [Leclercia sp. LSNIH1]|uniref:type VI secretion system protein TssL, short form n=1 Tax=Leclercia sp. LSNIH1 TaxID=1920114 RepID=UPI000CD189C1|nr:type VI secretion system protein TssL, short form [Leclercia sp. LSNIH1]AUU85748.1 type VI secretion system protein ImpK [Leclercia sp. LSNIH1]POV36041.1 type VI secretion system protein ImpK [Leclercia sp. LSNIH5]POW69014.1 type VI secretion system protein ImpK [Leclercia sp. LSNIH2]
MNTSDTELINRIFYPGWLMVSQLRSGQEIKDGEALYRRACRWVNDARESLAQAGYSETSSERMLYAYCALLDESVLNRDKQDDGYRKWRKDPLQARFFSTLNAGEELWERIRTILREPAPDVAVLTCLYRTLQLGFVGQYRAQDDERREDVVRALSERVPPFTLTQDAPVIVRASGLRSGRWIYWLGWAAGIVVLAALWLTFSSVLAQMVSQIAGRG